MRETTTNIGEQVKAREKCPVCGHKHSRKYISTNAQMHAPNSEHFYFKECADCNSAFLANPVEPEKLSEYYTRFYLPYRGAQAWGKFRDFVDRDDRALNQKRLKTVNRAFPLNAKTRILDLGCGKPDFLQAAYDKYGSFCCGTDFSGKGWRNGYYPKLSLKQGDIHDLKFDDKFDVITAWHYMEHDYNPVKTVELLHALLKPGGVLVFEVPHHESITAKIQKEHWQGWHSPRHLTLFSTRGIKKLFDSNCWSPVHYKKSGTLSAFTLWWLGVRQKRDTDWSASMEKHFWPLVFLKVATAPFFMLESLLPMGIQTAVYQKKGKND